MFSFRKNERRRVLVIAAHPDDEVLGCGGSIAKHINVDDEVSTVIMAEGITSRDDQREEKSREAALNRLKDVALKANNSIGVQHLTFLGLPDNRMDEIALLDIVKPLERIIKEYSPDIVYTHHVGDLNIDHRITHQAVITSLRPIPQANKSIILTFEVPSSTEWQTIDSSSPFTPNMYVDINTELTQKLSALKIYESEMREWPHARSIRGIEALARWRGCSAGLEAAEAFFICRAIV